MTAKEHGLKKQKRKTHQRQKLKLSQKMDSKETGRVSFSAETRFHQTTCNPDILFSLVLSSGFVLLKMEKCAANRRARINPKNKQTVYSVVFVPLPPQARTKWKRIHHQALDHVQKLLFPHW